MELYEDACERLRRFTTCLGMPGVLVPRRKREESRTKLGPRRLPTSLHFDHHDRQVIRLLGHLRELLRRFL